MAMFALAGVTTIALSLLAFLFLRQKAGTSAMLRHSGGQVFAGPGAGLVFICAIAVWMLVTARTHVLLTGICISSMLMLFFGMFDDYREQPVGVKLSLQLIAVAVLYAAGVKAQIAGIGWFANALITFLWVIGIANAINHLDIADGLAGGVILMISSALAVVAGLNGDQPMAYVCLVVVCISAAFLVFNLPPASMYLGNSGSHFFGFLLAAVSLAVSYAPTGHRIALLSPLFIFGFPIFDTVFVSLMRIKKGRSAVLKSDDHLAMRLRRSGLNERRTLWVMLWLSAFFCCSGLVLSKAPTMVGVLVIAVVFLVSVAVGLRMNEENAG